MKETSTIPNIANEVSELNKKIIALSKSYNQEIEKIARELEQMLNLSELIITRSHIESKNLTQKIVIQRRSLRISSRHNSDQLYAKLTIILPLNGTCSMYGTHVRNNNEESDWLYKVKCLRSAQSLFRRVPTMQKFLEFKITEVNV